MADKVEKTKEPNRFQRYIRETIGELRKVKWPTTKEAWHLTKIVLAVLAGMAILLGALDFLFSELITLIVS